MFFAVASPSFDIAGAVVTTCQPGSNPNNFARRVSRSATLDGGAVITDHGFADGDRTIRVKLRPNATQYATLNRLCRTYPLLIVSTVELCALAACETFEQDDGEVTLTFLVQSKLSA